MKRFKEIVKKVYRSTWLKYGLVTVLAVVLIGFVDENSFLSHFSNKRRISELHEEIDRYNAQYQHDKKQIKVLDSNPKAIEKIARERYFMKADDEDIFVLSDDKPNIPHTDDESIE